jgi:hypothetical protein
MLVSTSVRIFTRYSTILYLFLPAISTIKYADISKVYYSVLTFNRHIIYHCPKYQVNKINLSTGNDSGN